MGVTLQQYSSELMILLLAGMVMATLIVLVPQLLKDRQRATEMRHLEVLKAMEQGQPLPPHDVRSRAAGRTSTLVPMTTMIAAGTVTCFLVAYKSESLFSVAIVVWITATCVSLAAVTGGVTLMGRLAHLELNVPDEDESEAAEEYRRTPR